MKAIRISHTGGPEVMELVDLPTPQAKADHALVKVGVAGVNSIDVQFRDGRLRTPLPFIPGQEGAGVVTATGPQAKVVKVGDRVAGAVRWDPMPNMWQRRRTTWFPCRPRSPMSRPRRRWCTGSRRI